MKNSKLRFLRFSGSKLHFVDEFNKITKPLNCSIYCEPFLGSGAIFFNLNKEYKHYQLSDINENIVKMFLSLQKYEYKDFEKTKNHIFNIFGDIKENKDSYYKFREWYNTKVYNKMQPQIDGMFIYFLTNSCINSMMRFGKNGFNQGWGHRLYFFDKYTFNLIKEKIMKNVLITVHNFFDNFIYNDNEEILYFIDPPYITNRMCYKYEFEQHDLEKMLDIIKNTKAKVMYTDIINNVNKKILKSWNKVNLNKARKISPNNIGKTEAYEEVCFYNF